MEDIIEEFAGLCETVRLGWPGGGTAEVLAAVDQDRRQRELIAALRHGRLKLCLLLISRGANLMQMTNGRTSLDLYGEKKYPERTPDGSGGRAAPYCGLPLKNISTGRSAGL